MLAQAYYRTTTTDVASDCRPYLIHRLDMATSGLMCLAKNRQMARILSSWMSERKVDKEYLALLCNYSPVFPFPAKGVIRQSLEEPERLWSV